MVQRFHNNSPFRSILVLSIAPFLLFCLVGSLSNTFLLDDQVVLSDLEGNPHVFDEVGGSFVGHGNFSAFQAGDVVLSEDGTSLVLSSGLVNSMTVCPPGGAISNCRITNNGLLEDPIFLSYFPMVLATLLLGRNLGKGMEVLVDATSENFVLIEPDGGSTLSVKDESNLRTIQNAIIDNISWWPSSSDIHSLRSLFFLGSGLGFLFFIQGTFQHLNALDAYGFDIWASSSHLAGFISRAGYEFVLYTYFFPLVFFWLCSSIFLKHYTIRELEEENAFRFLRFSIDEVAGMGEFGNQSIKNILLTTPLLLPILAYLQFYPSTALLKMGLYVYVLALPVIFLWPLLGARRAMVRMKKSELSEITHTFEEAYHLFKSAMKDNKNPAEEDLVYADLLLKSEAIYDSISRMTVWPFNKQHVARLGSVMTIIATMTTIVSFFRI